MSVISKTIRLGAIKSPNLNVSTRNISAHYAGSPPTPHLALPITICTIGEIDLRNMVPSPNWQHVITCDGCTLFF